MQLTTSIRSILRDSQIYDTLKILNITLGQQKYRHKFDLEIMVEMIQNYLC